MKKLIRKRRIRETLQKHGDSHDESSHGNRTGSPKAYSSGGNRGEVAVASLPPGSKFTWGSPGAWTVDRKMRGGKIKAYKQTSPGSLRFRTFKDEQVEPVGGRGLSQDDARRIAEMRGDLKKHGGGSHDDGDHGNWARGTSAGTGDVKTPTDSASRRKLVNNAGDWADAVDRAAYAEWQDGQGISKEDLSLTYQMTDGVRELGFDLAEQVKGLDYNRPNISERSVAGASEKLAQEITRSRKFVHGRLRLDYLDSEVHRLGSVF